MIYNCRNSIDISNGFNTKKLMAIILDKNIIIFVVYIANLSVLTI